MHSIPHLVISADTVVVLGNKILEKPADTEHACEMLQELSGKTHYVFTAVCFFFLREFMRVARKSPVILDAVKQELLEGNVEFLDEQVCHQFVEMTEVTFDELSSTCIKNYVDTGEPM